MHTGRKLLTAEELTEAERDVVACATTGTWWEAPDSAALEAKTIRAQVLYQLLTGHGELCADEKGQVLAVRAVRMIGPRAGVFHLCCSHVDPPTTGASSSG